MKSGKSKTCKSVPPKKQTKNQNNHIEKFNQYPLYYNGIRVCQDCGYLETCHGPVIGSSWRHIILHPDYHNLPF